MCSATICLYFQRCFILVRSLAGDLNSYRQEVVTAEFHFDIHPDIFWSKLMDGCLPDLLNA